MKLSSRLCEERVRPDILSSRPEAVPGRHDSASWQDQSLRRYKPDQVPRTSVPTSGRVAALVLLQEHSGLSAP
ncbi:hypothetical protein [Acetobacter musti]